MRVYRQRKNRRFPTALKVMFTLVLMVGLAFTLALYWQRSQELAEDENIVTAPISDIETSPPELEEDTGDSPTTAAPEDMSEEENPTTAETSAEPPTQERTEPQGALPKTPLVPNSYFDDALFIGDSISTGIPLYHVADNAVVVAMAGITPENINHRECIEMKDGSLATVLDAAAQYGERGKIYIMLGGNGLNLDKETFLQGYKVFIDSVKAQYPGALIYLQSMTPVVKDYDNELNPNLNNATIDEFNAEILALAKREGVYYLDVASVFKDEEGNLPEDASPVDGLHFTPEYYAKWFEYLRTHAITTEDRT